MTGKKEKQPLSLTHPELAKEADGWDTSLFVAGSHKKVSWNCSKGHSFIAAIQDRTRRGDKCSICAGKQVLIGFNDLKSLFPEIASQAIGWDPEEFTPGSGKTKSWRCKQGHTWNATIGMRTGKHKTGCGVCNGKQVVAGINDLQTHFPDVAKEADGWDPTSINSGSHKKMPWICSLGHKWKAVVSDRTRRKDHCPICSGRKVLAGFNDLATTHPLLAKEAYGWETSTVTYGSGLTKKWKCSQGHSWNASISSRTNMNSGCPFCSGNKVLEGFNDLKTTHPSLAIEIIDLNPAQVSSGSNKIANWKCQKNHQFKMSVRARVNSSNCPICSGARVLAGFNDLQTTHPEVAALANGWDPKTLSAGSNKECHWICDKSHKWKAPVFSLTGQNTRCPNCSGQQLLVGFNDLATTHPQIASEAYRWDPITLGANSDKRMKWQCHLGHIYEAFVYNKTIRGDKCSICSGKKVLVGFNDLETTHPKFARLADGWDPKLFTAGSNKNVAWICPLGHKWKAMIGGVTNSKNLGCPSCAQTGFDPNENGWLYFINHRNWEMLQIGITNFPDDRLKKHSKLGWELIELRGPMDGHLTQQWETAILRMLKAKGADLSNSKIAGKFDGYSEAWSKSTFEVKSIKELMKLTEEFEDDSKN